MTGSTKDTSSGTSKVTPLSRSSESSGFGDQHLERLATSFEVSARRWELVVYPALLMFVVLAIYGFYLIYNLTRDVGLLAENVASLTTSVYSMAGNMDDITLNMRSISNEVGSVSNQMSSLEPMRESISSIDRTMTSMDHNTRSMAVTMDRMNYNVGAMNYNVGKPMGMMNSFMPW